MRHGATMLELLVVIVILAIVAGVVTVAFQLEPEPAAESMVAARRVVARAKQRAVREGHAVATEVRVRDATRGVRTFAILALPDGSVIADSALKLSRLTGADISQSPTVAIAHGWRR